MPDASSAWGGKPAVRRFTGHVRAPLLLVTAAICTALAGCDVPTTSPTPTPRPTGTSAGTSGGGRTPAGFVALSEVDSTILQEIRYSTPYNFIGRPIDGYLEPLCLLTKQAAEALHRVQLAARGHGYSLKVYDCYRPQRAVDDFVRWSHRLDDQQMKAEFYPRVDKSVLFDEGYIGNPSAHSRGGTVDLTLVTVPPRAQRPYVPGEALVSCFAPEGQRFPDNSIDMGTGFDCFDALAHTQNPRVTGSALGNRLLLKRLMTDANFTNYTNEWWHYTLTGEPYPDTYFDFRVERGAVLGG